MHTIAIRRVLIILALLLSFSVIQAQNAQLVYGNTVTGEINATTPQQFYTFNAAAGDWITAYVIGTASEFQPTLALLGPAGQIAFQAEDHLTPVGNDARISYRLDEPGAYSLLVGSANGTPGTFVLALRVTLPAIATTLTDQPLSINIPVDAPPQSYNFTGSINTSSEINISSTTPGFGFTARVSDGNGRIVAALDSGIERATLVVPASDATYEVTIAAADPQITGDLTLSVTGAATAATQPGAQPTQPVVLPANQCVVLATPTGVNIRRSPSLEGEVIGGLAANSYLNVTGQSSGWYAVNYFGETGWISATVVQLSGPCDAIPVLTPEVTQQPEMTETVAPEVTQQPEMTMEPEMTQEPEMTMEPAPEATEDASAQAQLAPADIDQATTLSIKQPGSQSISGDISYPQGDIRDVINFTITDFDSVTTFKDIQWSLTCNGDTANVTAMLGGQSISCNGVQTIQARGSNNQGTGDTSLTFTIEITSGDPAYVGWQLQYTPQ